MSSVRGVVLAGEHGLGRDDVLVEEGAIAGAQVGESAGGARDGRGHPVSIAGVRLGYYMGYAAAGHEPARPRRARHARRSARLRLGVGGGGLGHRRGHAARVARRAHDEIKLGSAIMQIPGAHAGE